MVLEQKETAISPPPISTNNLNDQQNSCEKQPDGATIPFAMRKKLISLILLLLVTACNEEAPTAVTTPQAANTAVATVTNTPIPATATATPQPTPSSPTVTVDDQPLTDDGQVTIASVTVPEAAWLVIHAEHDGQIGEVLGQTAVPPGTSSDIIITIDPLQATPRLAAMLHQDAAEIGIFEFPGPDAPWLEDGEAVAGSFDVDIRVDRPEITIADQEILDDGLLQVEAVYAINPGWLLIHNDDDGEIGSLLSFTAVNAGLNEKLTIPLQWREATPTLHAVLYEDRERSNQLDYPEGDLPVIVNGQPVLSTITITLPPDILVLDQPVIDGKIVVDRVVSNGPGWLVIYYDDGGLPGFIIGSAPLADGLNEMVEIEVVESAVTKQLHLQIHDDTDPIGEFNFPGDDNPRLYRGRLPATTTFLTDGGNYLLAEDQKPVDKIVNVPLVVIESPAWLIVRSGNEPQSGSILGRVWLPAGINRDVTVELALDPDLTYDVLVAVLHNDAEVLEQFEYPSGDDRPLEYNGRIIFTPFSLLPLEE